MKLKKTEKLVLEETKNKLLIDCHAINEKGAPFAKIYTANFYEIHLVEKGNINFYIDHQKINIKEKTLLMLPPSKIRRWEVTGQIESNLLIFQSEFLTSFFNDDFFLYKLQYFQNIIPLAYIELSEEEFCYFRIFFKEIEQEIKNYKSDSSHLLRASTYYFLLKLNNIYSKRHNIKDSFAISNRLVLRFLKLLDEQSDNKISVQVFSDKLKVSKTHLNNVLKKQLGVTALPLINDALLQKAKKQLLFSNKTISEIAFNLGFSDKSNFTRFFKSKTNLSPTQYIKEWSK